MRTDADYRRLVWLVIIGRSWMHMVLAIGFLGSVDAFCMLCAHAWPSSNDGCVRAGSCEYQTRRMCTPVASLPCFSRVLFPSSSSAMCPGLLLLLPCPVGLDSYGVQCLLLLRIMRGE